MVVSIDFDRTWTQDPTAWRVFSNVMAARGHTVIVTTNRFRTPVLEAEVLDAVAQAPAVHDVVFAGPRPKREMTRRKGYDVDVWIDDNPSTVEFGVR